MTDLTSKKDDAAGTSEVPPELTDVREQETAKPSSWRSTAHVLVLIVALGIVALGLFGGLLGLVLALVSPGGQQVTGATISVSLLALTVGLGLPLAWHAWRATTGRPSSTFWPPTPWPLVGLFFLAVAAGQLVLSLELLPALLFPPLHVAAGLAPPLIIVAWVARGLGGAGRWRDAVLQLGSGAFVATPLAFVAELVLIAGLAVLAVVGLVLWPGGQELMSRLGDLLADGTWLQNPDNLLPIVRSPLVIVAILVVAAFLVPLIEELAKTVGVGLMAYRRPDAGQAMLWGLAGGAGFAIVEGLFNTANSLDAWAPVILLRVGATLLHCTAGALMGLAWYQVLIRRRWAPALGLYAASVGIHAAWNSVSVGVALISLGATEGEALPLVGLGSMAMIAALLGLSVAMALLLSLLTRRLRQEPTSAAGQTENRPALQARGAAGTMAEETAAGLAAEEGAPGEQS